MNELIFVVEEAPEGGFIARALGESIFTEADDLGQLQDQVRDAVLCHFEDEEARPKLIRGRGVKPCDEATGSSARRSARSQTLARSRWLVNRILPSFVARILSFIRPSHPPLALPPWALPARIPNGYRKCAGSA